MTWNLFGQYLGVALACTLIFRIFRLNLWSNYTAFLIFVGFDLLQSIVYIVDRYLSIHGVKLVDYRLIWCAETILAWFTTIGMVYALLAGILKHLPGILKFSFRLLNIIFGVSAAIAIATILPEYSASKLALNPDLKVRAVTMVMSVERAFSFAELLAILAIMIFVLRFPIRVPRNLAAFCAGISIYLTLRIGNFLLATYLPDTFESMRVDPLPYIFGICIVYWIAIISVPGEQAQATLGRNWHSVPRANLVNQLEAINAALLRSREQS